MATRRSTYFFSSEQDYENAKNDLHDKMYQDYQSPDKLYFEGWYGGEYVISIMEYCSNPELAASIMRDHGGAYKNYPFE